MGFIYKVTNNINGKVYIGQSIFKIDKRFREHLKEQIEIAYKQFYDNNKQILDYYKIIFDNFVENNYPFQHIIDDLTHFNANPKNFKYKIVNKIL